MQNSEIYQKKCDELKQTHELPIIRKIRLGDNFARKHFACEKVSIRIWFD